jgi:transcriptional regulator with XRE-family HTH domain
MGGRAAEQIAKLAGISQALISGFENGKTDLGAKSSGPWRTRSRKSAGAARSTASGFCLRRCEDQQHEFVLS